MSRIQMLDPLILPFLVMSLSLLLIMLSITRRRLQLASAKSGTKSLPAEVSSALRKRRLSARQRRQAARKEAAQHNECASAVSVISNAPAMEEDVGLRKRCGSAFSTDESDTEACLRSSMKTANRCQALTLDVDKQIQYQPLPAAVQTLRETSDRGGAAALACEEPMCQDIQPCSCSVADTWGCSEHAVYSLGLLLAHRDLSIKIARGPPGLSLPQEAAEKAAITARSRLFMARVS